jgi:ketosteroid isomerase-like protein
MRPSIGRILHVVDTGRDEACHAAIVVHVTEGETPRIDVVMFERPDATTSGGPFAGPVAWYLDVRPGRELEGGLYSDGWHWPERVE